MSQSQTNKKRPAHLISQVEALEKMIQTQLEQHGQLLETIRSKREALRHADVKTIIELTDREKHLVEQVAEVDRHRTKLVQRLTLAIDRDAEKPLTISELAEALEGELVADRLLALAGQLREIVQTVRKESSVVRNAADALSRHLGGVMQQVHSALSRARVYSKSGHIAVGAQLQSSVDLKT